MYSICIIYVNNFDIHNLHKYIMNLKFLRQDHQQFQLYYIPFSKSFLIILWAAQLNEWMMDHLILLTWINLLINYTALKYSQNMPHIYQMLYHRTNEFRNHSYCHEYGEVVYLNLLITIFMVLHWQEHDVTKGGEWVKCKVMRRMRRQGKTNLVL